MVLKQRVLYTKHKVRNSQNEKRRRRHGMRDIIPISYTPVFFVGIYIYALAIYHVALKIGEKSYILIFIALVVVNGIAEKASILQVLFFSGVVLIIFYIYLTIFHYIGVIVAELYKWQKKRGDVE
jgi:hypothetical protein